MWYTNWTSQNGDIDCCLPSPSNTLHFLGNSEAVEIIKKMRSITRNVTTLSQQFPDVKFSSGKWDTEKNLLMKLLQYVSSYQIKPIYPGAVTKITQLIEVCGYINFLMIMLISCKTISGLSKMNHVIGVYHNNIIDGESTNNRIIIIANLDLACVYGVKFHRVCKVFILIPWQ